MSAELGGEVYRFTRPNFHDYHIAERNDGSWVQHNGGNDHITPLEKRDVNAWFDEEYAEEWEQESVTLEESPFSEGDLA